MNLSQFQDDTVRAEQPLIQAESAGKIDLPVASADWTRANEIRAEINLPPSTDSQILCNLTLESRTEGFDTQDGYWFNAIASPRGGNLWEGWKEYRFPAECFYHRGIPDGTWAGMQSAGITVPEGARIRNIRLIEREIVPGPRMTDSAFINALNLDHPGLESAKHASSSEETLREIARYFRTCDFNRELIPSTEPVSADLEAAENIVNGHVRGQDWSQNISWQANPTGYIEWTLALHYLNFMQPAMDAYWQTRDARYAKAVERYVTDWIGANPLPYGVRAGGYPWGHSLVAAIRPFSSLVEAFRILCACPDTEDQSILDTLKSFYEHEACLLDFQSYPPSNKTIAEGRTLAALGCAFPEFKDAPYWREEGARRLLDDMRVQVMPDGASYELTPGYQMAIASWFLEAFQTIRNFNRPLDPELEAGIRRMYRWCTAITRPDFTRPSVSDAGSTDSKYRQSLVRPGRILNDPAALWAGTEGKEGSPPDYTSIGLQDSGYFVMRSAWDRNAAYLLFEGGPYGRWHQHEDMLSFDLHAGGIPFIVDPGITSYYPNPWTTFYRTTQAHNTVLVDGCPQARGRNQSIAEWVEPARNKTTWRTDDRSDVAVATYDAPYAGLDATVHHRRAIIFMKPNYFLLFDELTGEGRHTYEALFHFMPYRVLIDPDTKAVRTGRMNPPNLEILPLVKMTPRLVCGQNDPVQGWLALGGQDVPAPVAIYKKTTNLPLRTGYVLAPFTEGVTAGITAKTTRRSDIWTVRITHPDGREDRVRMDWNSGEGPELQ